MKRNLAAIQSSVLNWLGNEFLQCDGRAVHLLGNQLLYSPHLGLAGQLLDCHGDMLVVVDALKGCNVCRARVNYDQLSARHINLLEDISDCICEYSIPSKLFFNLSTLDKKL